MNPRVVGRFLRWTGPALVTFLSIVVPSFGAESPPDAPVKPLGPWCASFYLGYFAGEDSPGQLDEARGGLALGVGVGRFFGSRFAADLDMLVAFRTYDTPSGIAFATDRLWVTSLHVMASARVLLATGRVRPYLGAGAGFAFARLDVPSSFVPFAMYTTEEDVGGALEVLGGLDIVPGRDASRLVFVEYRDLRTDVEFDLVPGGDTEIGGWVLEAGYRKRF